MSLPLAWLPSMMILGARTLLDDLEPQRPSLFPSIGGSRVPFGQPKGRESSPPRFLPACEREVAK